LRLRAKKSHEEEKNPLFQGVLCYEEKVGMKFATLIKRLPKVKNRMIPEASEQMPPGAISFSLRTKIPE